MTDTSSGPPTGLDRRYLHRRGGRPFAAGLLGDYGAEIKVEMPGQATACAHWRRTRTARRCGGRSLIATRGALRSTCARPRDAICSASCRPTPMCWSRISARHARPLGHHPRLAAVDQPGLTILRVSGLGQDGPYRDRPGFARIFEAMSGFTRICGEEGGRPLHLGYPISDAIAGLFGALGRSGCLARSARHPERRGQRSTVRPPRRCCARWSFSPSSTTSSAPFARARATAASTPRPATSIERATASGPRSPPRRRAFLCVCAARSLEELLRRSLRHQSGARENYRGLDDVIGDAIGKLSSTSYAGLTEHEVGFSPIYDIADVFDDPQFARVAIVRVPDAELGSVRMQGVVPVSPRRRSLCAVPARRSASTTTRFIAPCSASAAEIASYGRAR